VEEKTSQEIDRMILVVTTMTGGKVVQSVNMLGIILYYNWTLLYREVYRS